MKVVVTGGSGQLGSVVLERLAAQRKIKKILSLDLEPPRVVSAKLEYRIADLKDPGLERHLDGADALVHLAFIVTARAPSELMHTVNVEGSRRMFEAAALHGVGTIVYSSSAAAYGLVPDQPRPIVESTPRRRTGYLTYADNKFDVEEYLDRFEADHPAIRVVRLRPPAIVGRRMAHTGRQWLKARVLPIIEDVTTQLVWDEDVAAAVECALLSDARGAFNVAAAAPLPLSEIARAAGFRTTRIPGRLASAMAGARKVMRRSDADRVAGWMRAACIPIELSNERALGVLGWKPRYPSVLDVAVAFGKEVSEGLDPRILVYLEMARRVARRAGKKGEMPTEGRMLEMKIHLDITGRRGGDYRVELERGKVTIAPGIPRPPDAVVQVAADTFLGLLAGKETVSTARMTGKVRVRGEPMASFVFDSMVTGFRQIAEKPGASGTVARQLSRWFNSGTHR